MAKKALSGAAGACKSTPAATSQANTRICEANLEHGETDGESSSVARPLVLAEAGGPQNPGGYCHSKAPITPAEAEKMWQRLQVAASEKLKDNPYGLEALWIVGRHGDEPLGVGLVQRGRICVTLMPCEGLEWAILPKVRCKAGSQSLNVTLNSCLTKDSEGGMRCPAESRGELTEALRSLYIKSVERQSTSLKPIPDYDSAKPTLSLRSAESVAAEAFKMAIRSVRPKDAGSFAIEWATAALHHVTGQPGDVAILTPGGMARLELIRSRNVHKTKQDIQSQHLEMERRLTNECAHVEHDLKSGFDKLPVEAVHHLLARHASYEVYRQALEVASTPEAKNLKPFSQRFIKGMVLAKVSGAKLCIGHLSDAISKNLGVLYGDELIDMQEAKVFLNQKEIPELWQGPAKVHASGKFCLSGADGAWLATPHIYLPAEIMMFDARSVFHEFRHARQELACEGPFPHFSSATYESMPTEIDAKQEEARMIAHFGVLF